MGRWTIGAAVKSSRAVLERALDDRCRARSNPNSPRMPSCPAEAEPATCGLGTLVVLLNALGIEPPPAAPTVPADSAAASAKPCADHAMRCASVAGEPHAASELDAGARRYWTERTVRAALAVDPSTCRS